MPLVLGTLMGCGSGEFRGTNPRKSWVDFTNAVHTHASDSLLTPSGDPNNTATDLEMAAHWAGTRQTNSREIAGAIDTAHTRFGEIIEQREGDEESYAMANWWDEDGDRIGYEVSVVTEGLPSLADKFSQGTNPDLVDHEALQDDFTWAEISADEELSAITHSCGRSMWTWMWARDSLTMTSIHEGAHLALEQGHESLDEHAVVDEDGKTEKHLDEVYAWGVVTSDVVTAQRKTWESSWPDPSIYSYDAGVENPCEDYLN